MVVMGDMNVRVSCDVSVWGEVLGRNGEEFATRIAGG